MISSCMMYRIQRVSALPPASATAGAGGDPSRPGGAGAGGAQDIGKVISSQLKTAANVEFGQVQTQVVGDVADLRKRLASVQ
jgi:hypothetical protein